MAYCVGIIDTASHRETHPNDPVYKIVVVNEHKITRRIYKSSSPLFKEGDFGEYRGIYETVKDVP